MFSSDAIRQLVNQCPSDRTHLDFLDEVISQARVTYPTDDGWIVLNTARMQELLAKRQSTPQPHIGVAHENEVIASGDDVPVGSGSLAETILSANVAAAYQLIGRRPMVALADASTDLDALYRQKQGHPAVVSELLTRQAEGLDPEKIKAAISALTSALDGVYTTEEEAVKMAILKAVKAIS